MHQAMIACMEGPVHSGRAADYSAWRSHTVSNGKIIEIHAIADPQRVQRIAASIF
jgi:hypothetical protein